MDSGRMSRHSYPYVSVNLLDMITGVNNHFPKKEFFFGCISHNANKSNKLD